MLETKTWVFIGVTIFVGLLQFGISLILRKHTGETKREEFQRMAFRQWGKRALVFAFVLQAAYFLKESAANLILIVYFALVGYNGILLRKMTRKIDVVYPLTDPNGEKEIKKEDLLK